MTAKIYDGFDRTSQTTYADGSYEAATYDANGNVLTARNRYGEVSTMVYDQLNKTMTMTPPSGSGDTMRSFVYDRVGHPLTIANGQATFTYGSGW